MFPFFLGIGWLGKWLDDFMKTQSTTPQTFANFATDLVMSKGAFDFLAVFEAFKSKAYKVAGENFYTIGIGSTRIFSNDGKTSRPVQSTDVLTLDQAKFHMRMYYNSSNSPKIGIDAIIKQYGIKLNQKFYDMLCQFSYASGSFHRSKSFQSIYINMLKRANGSNDVEMLGNLIRDTWIQYLKINANYTAYGLGWSRRAFAGSQYVKGLDFSMNKAVSIIKKPY